MQIKLGRIYYRCPFCDSIAFFLKRLPKIGECVVDCGLSWVNGKLPEKPQCQTCGHYFGKFRLGNIVYKGKELGEYGLEYLCK